MSYIVERESYGRKERILDIARFAKNLAAALDGNVLKQDEDFPNFYQRITLADSLELTVSPAHSWGAGDREKVTLCLRPTDVSNDLHIIYSSSKYKIPQIHVSTARPIERIVADIKRRLIVPATAPITALREAVRIHQEFRNKLAKSVSLMKQDFPQLNIRNQNSDSASFFNGTGAHYINGQINSDGSVLIERMGAVSREQFAAIYHILYTNKQTKAA